MRPCWSINSTCYSISYFWKCGYLYGLTLTSSVTGSKWMWWLVCQEGGREVGFVKRNSNLARSEAILRVTSEGLVIWVEGSFVGSNWMWKSPLVPYFRTRRRSWGGVIERSSKSLSSFSSITRLEQRNFMVRSLKSVNTGPKVFNHWTPRTKSAPQRGKTWSSTTKHGPKRA